MLVCQLPDFEWVALPAACLSVYLYPNSRYEAPHRRSTSATSSGASGRLKWLRLKSSRERQYSRNRGSSTSNRSNHLGAAGR